MHSVVERASVLASLLFSPGIVSPAYGNLHSWNFATSRGFGVKRTFAMPISWNIPLKFLGNKKRKILAIFSALHAQMAIQLPNAKSNGKSKTNMYYGDVWSMLGWTLMGVWYILGDIHSVEIHTLRLEMKSSHTLSCVPLHYMTTSLHRQIMGDGHLLL